MNKNVEKAVLDLRKVKEIGKKTAACLYKIGIKTPQHLANADAKNIVEKFKEGSSGEGFYNVSPKYVEKWISAAKTGDWKYSRAEERITAIEQRVKSEKNNTIDLDIDSEAFREFFGEDSDERKCSYCGILESQIAELRKKKKIITKRFDTRGKSMEIDRKDPRKGYIHRSKDDSNIAICCYWCNNAKTDEFTKEEFLPIARKIGKIWVEREKGR